MFPVGVNYWPGSSGVEMWQRYSADEIQRDLDILANIGLNTIRFFVRWPDFEPQPGQYDPAMFQRLEQVLGFCRQRRIWAHPSLIVGFMSGGVFWPAWKGNRNVFADPFMVERSAALARRCAEVIRPFADTVLALDQGNELCCLGESREAPPAAVIEWCRTFNDAIRQVWPDCLIVSGNEQNQVNSDTGWRFGNQPGCDFGSMHGYPVPGWQTIEFDGMTDPLCQSILPFNTRIARAFGPVMLQEFGTIATFGRAQQDAYLRAMLPAAWEAGANGFLWWCLRDIRAEVHPYIKNSFEGTLGLVDESGKVKVGAEFFIEFARSLPQRPLPRTSPDAIGLYFPNHYYPRDNPLNPGNQPREMSRQLVIANHLLRTLGHDTRVVRGDLPIEPSVKRILITGAILDGKEIAALAQWVTSGGQLIWHGPDPFSCGPECLRLLGANPINYRAARARTVEFGGQQWEVRDYPKNACVEFEPQLAEVMARDVAGMPMVMRNTLGRGKVLWAVPLVEKTIAAIASNPESRDRWSGWYAQELRIVA